MRRQDPIPGKNFKVFFKHKFFLHFFFLFFFFIIYIFFNVASASHVVNFFFFFVVKK